jgi:hypothetical protein
MNIDEARREHEPGGIDNLSCIGIDVRTDLRYPVALDANVLHRAHRSRSIDNGGTLDHEVEQCEYFFLAISVCLTDTKNC